MASFSSIYNRLTKAPVNAADEFACERAGLLYSDAQIEAALEAALAGYRAQGVATGTRAAEVRRIVLEALGFGHALEARRTPVTLPAQHLHVFVQQSRKLQFWNKKPERWMRYAVVSLDEQGDFKSVRVYTGAQLIEWAGDATQTAKYNARLKLVFDENVPVHIAGRDSERLRPWTGGRSLDPSAVTLAPSRGAVLPLAALGETMSSLIGRRLPWRVDKPRLVHKALSRAVQQALGYKPLYNAAYPNVPNQALDVRIQTGPMLDLGGNWPSSDALVLFDGEPAGRLRRRDMRHALFIARPSPSGKTCVIEQVVLVSGARFFDVFEASGNARRHAKVQVNIPVAA